ncbi:MAG: HAD family hydrolase [Gemmatimonadaceae bacterium]
MPRGVIFDIDGTLVDSNRAHAESWAETLQAYGYSVSADDVQPLIGMGGDKLLPKLIGVDIESDDGKKYSEHRTRLFFRKYLPGLRAFPGGIALAERLRADRYVLVVASSASEDELEKLLEVAGIRDLLTDTTSSDDADRSKPDPDIVLAAVRRTGLNAEEMVMIGDTPYDVEAARRAGVRIIAVRSGGWNDESLTGASAVYDDVGALLSEYEKSVLARG